MTENVRNNGLPDIWVFCTTSVTVDHIVCCMDHIVVILATSHNQKSLIGFVHAHSLHTRRRLLWELKSSLLATAGFPPGPSIRNPEPVTNL